MDYCSGGGECVIETRMPNQSTVVLDIRGVMDASCNSEMTLILRDALVG